MIKEYRKEFPVTDTYIYLDHAGIAPTPLRVKRAIEEFLSESAGGGAFYYPRWRERIAGVRRSCAGLINATAGEMAFIKSTSHGLSLVAEGLAWKPGDNVLIYEKEFPSNIYPWLNLKRKGVEARVIPAHDRGIALDDIERLMDARTRLLSISSVQFAKGFRLDLKKTGELCRRRQVLFCVDAIQSLGLIPMDVQECHIDFLSADGHKWLLGPEGIGIFFCRKERIEQIHPTLIGWRSVRNEFSFDEPDFSLKTDALRFEEGSSNVMGIYGLGAAVDLLLEVGVENIQDRVLGLGDVIIREAGARGYRVLSPKERMERGGNVTFSGSFDPAGMRDALLQKGIMINCRGGGLRVSPHFYNTDEEIHRLFEAMDEISATYAGT